MRHPALLAAALAAALVACGVETEGAPCTSSASCPAGQGCGADGHCSAQALACAPCMPGETRCGGGGLELCKASGTVCSLWEVDGCGDSQRCAEAAGAAACVCANEPPECVAEGAVCTAPGEVASCGRDRWGCFTRLGAAACAAHEACGGGPGAAACACDPTPEACGAQTGAFCSDAKTVTDCPATAAGCTFLAGTTSCGPHQTCASTASGAACACDAAPACTRAGSFCSADGKAMDCPADEQGCVYQRGAVACGAHEHCQLDGTGAAATASCACDRTPDLCTQVGSFCAGNQAVSCAQDGACTYLASAVTCGPHQQCGAAGGAAACACVPEPRCPAEGTFCDASGAVVECRTDGEGCLYAAAATACAAHETCGGTPGAQACACDAAPPACSGTDAFCSDGDTVTTCPTTAHGCTYLAATLACGPHQGCGGPAGAAACACDAAPACSGAAGNTCAADHRSYATCERDGEACLYVKTAAVACGPHQTCGGAAGAAACACDPTPPACAGRSGTFCAADGKLVSCPVDGEGCTWLDGEPRACGPHQACTEAGGAACRCNAEPRCPAEGTFCDGSGTVSCARDGEGCLFASAASACAAPQVCSGAPGVAACACPAPGPAAGQGCPTVGAAACEATTGAVLACRLVGGCSIWQVATDCRASGLVCGTRSVVADCECPANPGQDFHADPVGGKAKGAAPFPTGLAAPPQCRFRTLGEALSAATAASTPTLPARAVATGWTATTGADVVFSAEALPLTVPNGVKLTTSDASLTVTHYHLRATVPGQPVVVLKEGSELSGFRIVNAVPSGSAAPAGVVVGSLAAPCGAGAPLATLRALLVDAAPAGTKPMTSTLTVGGGCAVEVTDAQFQGAATDGVVVSDAGTRALLHGVTVARSVKSGLVVQGGGKATLDLAGAAGASASALRDNGEWGLKLLAGEAGLVGASDTVRVDVSRNGLGGILAGVDLASARLDVRFASVHDHTGGNGNGIEIWNNDAAGAGQPMTVRDTLFSANSGSGVLVKLAAPGAGATPSVLVERCSVTGGLHGIWLASTGGPIWAALRSSTVSGATDFGVVVTANGSGSNVELTDNTVTGNGAGLTTRTGGLQFTGVQPVLRFQRNRIYGNRGDQVSVLGRNGWNLDAGACATANVLACYAAPAGYGLVTAGNGSPAVTARFTSWAADPPFPGADFLLGASGSIDASNACPAATVTCP